VQKLFPWNWLDLLANRRRLAGKPPATEKVDLAELAGRRCVEFPSRAVDNHKTELKIAPAGRGRWEGALRDPHGPTGHGRFRAYPGSTRPPAYSGGKTSVTVKRPATRTTAQRPSYRSPTEPGVDSGSAGHSCRKRFYHRQGPRPAARDSVSRSPRSSDGPDGRAAGRSGRVRAGRFSRSRSPPRATTNNVPACPLRAFASRQGRPAAPSRAGLLFGSKSSQTFVHGAGPGGVGGADGR